LQADQTGKYLAGKHADIIKRGWRGSMSIIV
jgi:hypothetical protein